MSRSGRRVAVTACLMAVVGGVTGSSGPQDAFRVLQMNLCDSGIARCYTGRAVQQAASVIRTQSPDVVTLNEVCRDDVTALSAALRDVSDSRVVLSAFQPVPDRRTGQPTRCRNGQPFGVGLVVRVPRSSATQAYANSYPMQDPDDPEQRVWLCLAITGRFVACTTHLAGYDASVALAQCDHLLETVLPPLSGGTRPALVSGDLNLRQGGTPDVRDCLPAGYLIRGDGGLQHVAATAGFGVHDDQRIDMAGTTDHPGLLVTLTAAGLTR